jgi:hypothetical protein
MTKRYFNVCAARPKQDGSTWWHRIGSAVEGDKGTTVFLDSLPIPNAEGKVQFSLFEKKDEQQGAAQAGAGQEPAPAARRGSIKPEDSDIPF